MHNSEEINNIVVTAGDIWCRTSLLYFFLQEQFGTKETAVEQVEVKEMLKEYYNKYMAEQEDNTSGAVGTPITPTVAETATEPTETTPSEITAPTEENITAEPAEATADGTAPAINIKKLPF